MVEDITALARETRSEIGKSAFDERVMSVLARVPRHEFVPADQVASAYRNRPLPIGHGQTISQPYIVALMTDLARVEPGHKVLEVGTGSGYQAAVMAELARPSTPSRSSSRWAQAAQRLKTLGYTNVQVRVGDGYNGWAEACAVRRHPRHRGGQPHSAATVAPAQGGRPDGDPGGRSVHGPATDAGREEPRRHGLARGRSCR